MVVLNTTRAFGMKLWRRQGAKCHGEGFLRAKLAPIYRRKRNIVSPRESRVGAYGKYRQAKTWPLYLVSIAALHGTKLLRVVLMQSC